MSVAIVGSCGGDADVGTPASIAGSESATSTMTERTHPEPVEGNLAGFDTRFEACGPPKVLVRRRQTNPFLSNLVIELTSITGDPADLNVRLDETRIEGVTVQCEGESFDGPYASVVDASSPDPESCGGATPLGHDH